MSAYNVFSISLRMPTYPHGSVGGGHLQLSSICAEITSGISVAAQKFVVFSLCSLQKWTSMMMKRPTAVDYNDDKYQNGDAGTTSPYMWI